MESSSDAITLLILQAHDQPMQANFTAFIKSNRDFLSDLIRRQLLIIRRRSADLKDGQVTIYDKVLLHLTRDGNDQAFQPALRLFCKEYLGLDEEDLDDARVVLEQYSILLKPIDQASTVVGSQRDSVVKPESEISTAAPSDARNMDPAFKRLMEVYEQARTEYLAVSNKNGSTTVAAAKFLRDTVENVIDNLEDKNVDAEKHTELRTMARMAKDTVENLCGGKKRKFDRDAERVQQHASCPPTSSSDRSTYPNRNGYSYNHREWRNGQRRSGRERSPIRNRGNTRDRSPDYVRLPYGYSRPVDSYYPA